MEPLDESQADNSSGVTVQQVTLAATVLTAGESSAVSESLDLGISTQRRGSFIH